MGQAITSALERRGDTFFTTARDETKIKPDMILDATDFEQVKEAFRRAGALDGVVNCSGSLLLKNAHLTNKSEYQKVIDASLTTAFATVHAAGAIMKSGGSVVLMSSAAALIGLPNHEAISAAKAAIIGLARSAAASYAHSNLRINVIAPGMVDTHLTKNLVANELFYNASKAMHPLGRLGSVNDIAQGVLFFLNPENSWITGQVLCIDGGLSHVKSKIKL